MSYHTTQLDGDAPVTLWSDGTVRGYQDRWREVQLRFVDDPRAAAEQAGTLVGEVLEELSQAVASRKSELDAWRGEEEASTEQMRHVVQRYRNLLDRLVEI